MTNKQNIEKKMIVDTEQYKKIKSLKKKFHFDDSHKFPYYKNSGKKYDVFYVLFGFKHDNLLFQYLNGDENDIRKDNIKYQHKYFDKIKDKFDIVEFINGHTKNTGNYSGYMINATWKTKNNIYIIHCANDNHVFMCEKTYNIFKKYQYDNGEISIRINKSGDVVTTARLTLKNIIFLNTNISGNTIDYIDGNKLNNQLSNFKHRYKKISIDSSIFENNEDKIEENTSEEINIDDVELDETKEYDLDELSKIIENKYNYKIITKIYGLDIKKGKNSGQKNINSKYVVSDENDEKFVMIHIGKDIFTKIDFDKLGMFLIKDMKTMYLHKATGYICLRYKNKFLCLHQLLMDFYGNKTDDSNLSVDHANWNKLDNRISNLRIVSQSVQNSNRKKPKRQVTAVKKLPEGITHDMMPSYVYYSNEPIYNKDGKKKYTREFFRIEGHPKLTTKCWSTSKSTKVGPIEKLKQAIDKLYELDNDIIDTSYKLPKGISKKDKLNGKIQLTHDAYINGKRINVRRTYKHDGTEKDLKKHVNHLLSIVPKS
jgi:hypothetical protein